MVGAGGKRAGNVFIDWSCLVNPHQWSCCKSTQSNPSITWQNKQLLRCWGVNLFSNRSGELWHGFIAYSHPSNAVNTSINVIRIKGFWRTLKHIGIASNPCSFNVQLFGWFIDLLYARRSELVGSAGNASDFIWQLLACDIGRDTVWGYSWFSLVPPGKFRREFKSVQDWFLPHPLQFIIHYSLYTIPHLQPKSELQTASLNKQ